MTVATVAQNAAASGSVTDHRGSAPLTSPPSAETRSPTSAEGGRLVWMCRRCPSALVVSSIAACGSSTAARKAVISIVGAKRCVGATGQSSAARNPPLVREGGKTPWEIVRTCAAAAVRHGKTSATVAPRSSADRAVSSSASGPASQFCPQLRPRSV